MTRKPYHDRLTISRIMVLTCGVGISLAIFQPGSMGGNGPLSMNFMRELTMELLIGLSLPGIYYPLRRVRAVRRLRWGALLWLALGIGIWLVIPAIILGRVRLGSNGGLALICTFYVVPLTSMWFVLAAIASGQFRRRYLRRTAPWTEKFGIYLGLAWCPLGLWIMFEVYIGAFA